MTIENELTIDAPAELVWDLTLDVERWPEITPTMTTVVRVGDGPIQVGSQARVKQPGQRATVWTVTRLEPVRLFEWEATVFGVRMVARHTLTPLSATQCRNLLQIEMTGRGAGLLGRLSGSRIRTAITTENECFQRTAASMRP
jgi:hypothetical protein